jgi:hypothetical protein
MFIVCRKSESGQVSYLMNSELWSVTQSEAVKLELADAASIAKDCGELYPRYTHFVKEVQ